MATVFGSFRDIFCLTSVVLSFGFGTTYGGAQGLFLAMLKRLYRVLDIEYRLVTCNISALPAVSISGPE